MRASDVCRLKKKSVGIEANQKAQSMEFRKRQDRIAKGVRVAADQGGEEGAKAMQRKSRPI